MNQELAGKNTPRIFCVKLTFILTRLVSSWGLIPYLTIQQLISHLEWRWTACVHFAKYLKTKQNIKLSQFKKNSKQEVKSYANEDPDCFCNNNRYAEVELFVL